MTSIDGYLRSLASQLRWRRIDEDSVATILSEVAAASADTHAPPADEFGKPAAYAQQFDKGSALPLGFVVGNTLAGLVLLAGFTRSAESISSGGSGFLLPLMNLITTITLVIGAILLGQVIDRRLPHNLRR